jgi:hypothetical protein
MESKTSLEKQLAKSKRALAVLNEELRRVSNKARSIAYDKFTKDHSKEYTTLENQIETLQTQLQDREKESTKDIPTELQEWVRDFQSGVSAAPMKIVWFSDNHKYLIVHRPGFSQYGDRMSGVGYCAAEWYLLKVVPGVRLYSGGSNSEKSAILEHIEGRLTKQKKQEWIDKIKELNK